MGRQRFSPDPRSPATLVPLLAGILAIGTTAVSPADTGAVGQERLEAVVKEYANPDFASPGLPAHTLRLNLENLEITLDEGRIYPILSKAGRWMGFVVQGSGAYRYVPRDPAETGTIRRALDETTARDFDRDGALQGPLSRAVALSTFDPLESQEKVAASAPVSEKSAIDRKWRIQERDKILKSIRESGWDDLSAVARMNGGDCLNVYIEGPTGRLRYLRDRAYNFIDRLWISGPKPRKTGSRLVRASPDAGSAGEASYWARLKDVSLDVEIREDGPAVIRSEEVCMIGRDRVRVLPFLLADAAKVRRVMDENGRDLEIVRGRDEVLVDLVEPRPRGSTVRLRFEMEEEADEDSGVVALRSDRFFMPTPMSVGPPSFTSTVRVRSPKPLRPVVPGELVALRDDGDSYALEVKNSVSKPLLSILAADYTTEEKVLDGITLRTHLLGWRRVKGIEGTTSLAERIVEALQGKLGRYPYESLDIAEVPKEGPVAGTGLPGIVWLTPWAFKQGSPFNYIGPHVLWPERVLAHEIAHQWFGASIVLETPDNEAWLAQSFAEYMSGTVMDVLTPEESEGDGFTDIRCEWTREAAGKVLGGDALVEEGRAGVPANNVMSARGPMVIHMLRDLAGDERFFQILTRFLRESADGSATTDRLQTITEEVLQTDMDWFFGQWVRGKGVPRVRASWRLEPFENGRAILKGAVEQDAGPGFKRLRIPIAVDVLGRDRRTFIVDQEAPVTEFRLEVDGEPDSVQFDPDCETLAVYKHR